MNVATNPFGRARLPLTSIGNENKMEIEKKIKDCGRGRGTEEKKKYPTTAFALRAHALFMFNQSYKCKLIHGAHTQHSTCNGHSDGGEKPKQSKNRKMRPDRKGQKYNRYKYFICSCSNNNNNNNNHLILFDPDKTMTSFVGRGKARKNKKIENK